MSTQNTAKKKPLVNLPFPMKQKNEQNPDEVLDDLRPRPKPYADRTWMAPRGTRRSFGKR